MLWAPYRASLVILRYHRWILFVALAALAGAAWAEGSEGFEGRWRVLEESQKAVESTPRRPARASPDRPGGARDLRVRDHLGHHPGRRRRPLCFDDHPRPPLYTDGGPSVIDSEIPYCASRLGEGHALVERTNNSGTRIEEQWRLIIPPPPREGAEPPGGPWLEARFLVRNALLEEPLELRLFAEPLKDASDAL